MKILIKPLIFIGLIFSMCLNICESKPLSESITKKPQNDHQIFKRTPIAVGNESSSSTGYAAIIQTEEPIIDLRPGKECVKWVKQPITNIFRCAKILGS